MSTAQEYYNDSSQWGQAQFITLTKVVDNFMGLLQDDDYLGTVKRANVIQAARMGITDLTVGALKITKAREFVLTSSLQIPMPIDYLNYIRISTVDDKGYLRPITVNSNITAVKAYLQDDSGNILFDQDGNVLTDENKSTAGLPLLPDDVPDLSEAENFYQGNYVFTPNIDRSQQNYNHVVVEDKLGGRLIFDSSLDAKSIVLEYISDGLTKEDTDGVISIHKYGELALYAFITYTLIKNKRNVPYNEKQRSKRDYYVLKKNASKRMNSIRKTDLTQVLKGMTVWNQA